MIRLTLGDGTRVIMNPAAVAYVQQLPDVKAGEKEQVKTKVVLMTGETLSVRQRAAQIFAAAGGMPRRRRGETESEAVDTSEE